MKVLVIDDEPLIRRSLEKAFVRSGHQVFLAVDGKDGVAKWKKIQPDAVVVDVLMPRFTGPEVISEVKAKEPVVIVLVSAHSGEYNPESVKSLGADVFIEKPFGNIQDIVVQVESLWVKKTVTGGKP